MKHLLNTLYVTSQSSYLSREGETVLVKVEGEIKLRVPIHTLGGIVCFGRVSCSPHLMELCSQRNVCISFLTEYGKFMARVQGPVSGNVLLRREQYRRADDETQSAFLARAFVTGKLANTRTVLLRAARESSDKSSKTLVESAAGQIAVLLSKLSEPLPLDVVRGFEGEGAGAYFNVFDHLISSQKEDFFFKTRTRRPPLDNMNSLLSFFYTLLVHDCRSALEGVGLDPQVGYLHRDRPGRPGLALDLMEEFRACLADRLALTIVNRQQVKGKGFRKTESGAVLMDDQTRKEVILAYQKRKQEEIQHPFINETVQIGLLPHIQAMLLARHLRGDIDGYPPFFWK